MTGDDNLLGGAIKASIAMVLGWIPKEHTRYGARRKLVRRNGSGVGVAKTSKDPKTSICRIHAK
jgi:hypothetical protein